MLITLFRLPENSVCVGLSPQLNCRSLRTLVMAVTLLVTLIVVVRLQLHLMCTFVQIVHCNKCKLIGFDLNFLVLNSCANQGTLVFLGCIKCMRCRLLLLMYAVSVCQSVTWVLNSTLLAGVIWCSLCQITLASCFTLVMISWLIIFRDSLV